jgi:hypothetical protein
VLRVAFGGEHCAAAKNQSAGAGGGTGDASQENSVKNVMGSSPLSSAANAFGSKLVGGLFKKKTDTAAAAPGSAPDNALPPGMVQAVQITVETTSINAAAVPAEKFEIPAGWKKIEPQAKETSSKEFTCPTSGS